MRRLKRICSLASRPPIRAGSGYAIRLSRSSIASSRAFWRQTASENSASGESPSSSSGRSVSCTEARNTSPVPRIADATGRAGSRAATCSSAGTVRAASASVSISPVAAAGDNRVTAST